MFSKIPIDKIMEIMTKYPDLNFKDVKIKSEIYDNAIIIKILGSETIGEMFNDFLPIMFSQIPESNIEIEDHRG